MKKFFKEYAAFNVWANERICEPIATLSDEQFTKEIVSSFPSIRATLLHLWDAQTIWLERFEGRSLSSFPSQEFKGTKEEAIAGVIQSAKKLEEKALNWKKNDLKTMMAYKTISSGPGESYIYQMIAHVMNHSTYHRGQLTTMLRQVGVTRIPQTDLIYYFRTVNREKDK